MLRGHAHCSVSCGLPRRLPGRLLRGSRAALAIPAPHRAPGAAGCRAAAVGVAPCGRAAGARARPRRDPRARACSDEGLGRVGWRPVGGSCVCVCFACYKDVVISATYSNLPRPIAFSPCCTCTSSASAARSQRSSGPRPRARPACTVEPEHTLHDITPRSLDPSIHHRPSHPSVLCSRRSARRSCRCSSAPPPRPRSS